MYWLILSLMAALTLGIVNVVDKIILEKYLPKPIVLTVFIGIYGFIPNFFVVLMGVDRMPSSIIVISILAGSAFTFYTLFYFKALRICDAPVVVASLQMTPIFSLLWGLFFFDEKFKSITYLGILIILSGITLISLEKKDSGISEKSRRTFGPALKYIIPCTFIMSIGYVLQKYALGFADNSTVFFWGRVGGLVASVTIVLFLDSIRNDFFSVIRTIKRTTNVTIVFNELLFTLAVFLEIVAFSIGTLSLVSTAISAQPLFVLLYITVINMVKRETIVNRASGWRTLLARTMLILLIVLGIYLISI